MISVIIPTYQRAKKTFEALKSVFNQEHGKDLITEIHVIDDGSKDHTLEFLQESLKKEDSCWKDRVFFYETSHRGVSFCRNLGIKKSHTPWLAFLDSDDQWLPHKCHAQVRSLESDGLLISHGEEIWIRNGRRVNPKKKHQKSGGWIFEPSLELCLMSPSAALIHRSVFKAYGLFDESFEVCEDFDLWLRLTRGLKVSFENEPLLVKHGGHEDQLSRKFIGMDRWRVKSFLKLLDSGLLTPVQKDKTLLAMLSKWRILELGYRKHGRFEELSDLREELGRYLNAPSTVYESQHSIA